MKIQYVSDIHLETRPNTSKPNFKDILYPVAPYLALCGDIGNPLTPNYEEFLKYCSENFELVFYVLGNHEYYNSYKVEKLLKTRKFITDLQFKELSEKLELDSVESRLRKIRGVCSKYPNIRLLNQDSYKFPDSDYVVIGCTLWSKLKMHPYKYTVFNDFYRICEDNESLLHPDTYNKWNSSDKEYIRNTLKTLYEENPNYKIIMLTHHCPTYDVIVDKYRLDDPDNMNSFFANDDEEKLVEQISNIKLWLCGHTHGCKKITVNDTIIATNTYGYDGEVIEGFKKDAIVEI
jgi:predicted MPP superfamily phosphohydrolase